MEECINACVCVCVCAEKYNYEWKKSLYMFQTRIWNVCVFWMQFNSLHGWKMFLQNWISSPKIHMSCMPKVYQPLRYQA